MVFRSFTGVKSGGLRAYNICLVWLLPIPAKIMELASWVSCHHKVHTCTHTLFYECLHTRAARNLTPVASHHLNTLSCISVDLFSHRAAGNIPFAWEQAERPDFLGCQKSLAEGAPTSCGFHLKPFTPPSGYPEMFHGRSARPK